MEKVAVYIDGFNLYFGLKAGYPRFKWLNTESLAKMFLKHGQTLSGVKYFTSRVSNNPDKEKRQNIYLEALESTATEIIYGHYQNHMVKCKRCGSAWPSANEKMTDVNIATRMIVDAINNIYDVAILVSGDSDLVPPILAIKEHFPNKKVIVAFPPKRHNINIKLHAHGSFVIGRKLLKDCQFPEKVVKPNGFILNKPTEW